MASILPGVSKERQRAMRRADSHFRAETPDWSQFLENSKRKSFVGAIQADPRSDEKLQRHVDQMSRLMTGKPVAQVAGQGAQTYDIVRLRGGGLGCTCNDWRYRKSVAPTGSQECKHIKEYRSQRSASPLIKAACAWVVQALRAKTS